MRLWLSNLWQKHGWAIISLGVGWGVFFTILFINILKITNQGLMAGHVHVWGDWSLHLSLAKIFELKSPQDWFLYHPYWSGGKLTYGFLTNLISGLLMRWGVSLPLAFALPSILYSWLLLIGLYVLFYLLTKSQKVSFIAINIFLLSSGLGFVRLFNKWSLNPTWDYFWSLNKDFSRLEEYEWLAGNFITGMLMPQRAILLGVVVGVWSLVLLIYSLKKKLSFEKKISLQILAGLLAGILPITHMHSYMALIMIAGMICLLNINWQKNWWHEIKNWITYPLVAAGLGGVLFFTFVAGGIENPEFMLIHLGWKSSPGLINWLIMWWQIWGLSIPIALAGLIVARQKPVANRSLWGFIVGSFLIFILANIVVFQPVWWDNSKLFMWSYLSLSVLSSLVIAKLWIKSNLTKILAILIFLALTLTGMHEILRLSRFEDNQVRMIDPAGMALGEEINQKASADAVFLTAPTHNHPVMMWGGRSIVMGYPTWVWNFGFEIDQRWSDLRKMYAAQNDILPLLKEYQVDYVVLGPEEINGELQANQEYFEQNFEVWLKSGPYTIYQVPY